MEISDSDIGPSGTDGDVGIDSCLQVHHILTDYSIPIFFRRWFPREEHSSGVDDRYLK